MKTKKFICLLLAVTIITLTGCGAAKEAEVESVPQKNMEAEELARTVERIEYMGLIAALDSDAYISHRDHSAYIGDADGDGTTEMVYGCADSCLIFNSGDNTELYYMGGQGGSFYTDASGKLYATSSTPGPLYSGNTEIGWMYCDKYNHWNGSEIFTAYKYCAEEYYSEASRNNEYWLSGDTETRLTTEEVEALGFTPAGSAPQELVSYSFDACYRDNVVQTFEDELTARYPDFKSVLKDIDGDGAEETLITIPEVLYPWSQYFTANSDYASLDTINYNITDIESGHTALLVINTKGNTTTVTAYGISENIYYDAYDIEFYTNYFVLGGYTAYIPDAGVTFSSLSGEERTAILTAINNNFISRGYRDTVFKIADVSDLPGEEILCFFQGYDGLYVDVISLSDGAINLIENDYMGNYSYYLVSHEGKTYILTYSQYVSSGYNPTYNYYYSLYRYGSDEQRIIADSKDVSYSASQSDATSVSSFFTALNVYLEGDLTVLHDTYTLTGKEWMDQSDIDFGERPTSSTEVPTEEGKLGFVKVYADTWLNLREGPGTQYDRVLLDPNNPQSFVKQALGSPVTILEEIETGDPDNPVWVKIRIVYQDQVLEGYSSKRYIKVVGE